MLDGLTRDPSRADHTDRLFDLLTAGDIDGLEALFHAFFASIPYEWYINNRIVEFEGYYAAVFYAYFAAALGSAVTVADSSSRAAQISRFVPVVGCICLSSRSWSRRGQARRWHSSRNEAMPTNTVRLASRSISWLWSSAPHRATWWRSSRNARHSTRKRIRFPALDLSLC